MITDGSADLNERIRQLVLAGRAGSEEYEELLAAWVAAMRAEVQPAA
jgi:hypothetical protein